MPFQAGPEYYTQAKQVGKNVHFIYCDKGGSKSSALSKRNEVYLKGHGWPCSQVSFDKVINAIKSIILKLPSHTKQLIDSDFEAFEGTLYAKHYHEPPLSLEEQSSSLAYNIYRQEEGLQNTDLTKAKIIPNIEDIDDFIIDYGIPAYITMLYLEQLDNKVSTIEVNTDWLHELNNDAIKKTIQSNFINFMEIANSKSYNDIELCYEEGFNFDQTTNHDQTIAQFKALLTDPTNPHQKYLMKVVLLNNLDLINKLKYFQDFQNLPEVSSCVLSLRKCINDDISKLNNMIESIQISNVHIMANEIELSGDGINE